MVDTGIAEHFDCRTLLQRDTVRGEWANFDFFSHHVAKVRVLEEFFQLLQFALDALNRLLQSLEGIFFSFRSDSYFR